MNMRLGAYRLSLKAAGDDRAAAAGAGLAAFELGRYPQAQRYLQAAVAANSDDAESADRLKTTDLVLAMDPFQRQISVAQRNRIVVEAFAAAAGERLRPVGRRTARTRRIAATESGRELGEDEAADD